MASAMNSSTTYKGWAQLEPLGDDNYLVSLPFPLGSPGRYGIGSRNSSDSVSLIIPEVEPSTGDKPLPIEANLVVTEKGEVTVERPHESKRPVLINGVIIEPGQSFPLPINATVTVGAWSFLFAPSKGVVINEQRLQKAVEIRRCQVCKSVEETVYSLSCGHNICVKCRREGSAQPPPFGFGRGGQVAQVPRTAVNGQQAAQVPKGHGQIEVQAMRAMQCVECRTRISIGVARGSISSVTINQAGKLLSDCDRINGHRPLCGDCGNKRGLIDARDYSFCETCQQMLCPLCILQWHRHHKLQLRAERLHNLDWVDQKLARATRSLATIDQQLQNLTSDKEITAILARGHRLGNAMAETIEGLNLKILECQQQLNFVLDRKRALGNGWDETSQAMVAAFDQYVQEFGELKKHVERLRNGEMSSTVSTSSDETNPSSGTGPSTSAPQSGASINSGPSKA